MIGPALFGFASLGLIAIAGVLAGAGAALIFGTVLGLKGARLAMLVLAIAAGGFVVGVLGGVWQYSAVKKGETEARRGWNLVPVVVAAVDVAAGETLTFDMISQRSIPEQFVTDDVVRPDSASYVVNQKVAVALAAGDLVMWSQFCAVTPPPDRTP